MFATIENFQSADETPAQVTPEQVQALQDQIASLSTMLAQIQEASAPAPEAASNEAVPEDNMMVSSEDEPMDMMANTDEASMELEANSPETTVEPFTNPSKNQVQSLIMILLVMCLFYLLSHPDTMKALTGNFKKLGKSNAHLVLTLVFGVSVLVLKRFL